MKSKTVILTRSRAGNDELSSRLKSEGFSPMAIDTMVFEEPEDWSRADSLLRQLHSFDWLVFTSATGVHYFGERARQLALKVPWQGSPKVAAVGPRTSSQLVAFGLQTAFVPSSYRTAALAEELPSEGGRKVLLLRADIADESLPIRLRERGFRVEGAPVYSTRRPKPERAPRVGAAHYVIFASPSAVLGLCSQLGAGDLDKLREAMAVCIGPVTEAAAKDSGFRHTVTPKSYTLEAVVAEVVRLSRRDD